MPRPHHNDPKCSRCGGELKRVRRSSGIAHESSDFRRYRCVAPSCGWDGLLARSQRRSRSTAAASSVDALRQWMPGRLWLVMGGLLIVLLAGAFTLFKMAFHEQRGVLATGGTPVNGSMSATPPTAPALQPRK
ncbi:MAG: hypothetical protein LH480_15145 [Rubrivivax sp.]|nr:hypothetical protein [Rubrivivax sp.]